MTAFIEVERSLAGFPSRAPYSAAIIDIEIPPAIIGRHTVVPVPGNAAELRILAEAVAAGSRRYQGEEVLRAKIVYPRPWKRRVGYDKLPCFVIKMSVNHLFNFLFRSLDFARDDRGEMRLEASRANKQCHLDWRHIVPQWRDLNAAHFHKLT